MHGLFHQFPIAWKMQQNPPCEEDLIYKYPYFFQSEATFLPSYSHPIVFYITSKIHGFFQSVSRTMGKCTKIRAMERSWDICTHNSPKLWKLPFYQIPIIWMVHAFFNEFLILWVNSAKPTYHIEKTWNINTYTFLKICAIFLPSNFCPLGY